MKGVKIVTLLLLSVIFATTTGLAGDGYNEPILKALIELTQT